MKNDTLPPTLNESLLVERYNKLMMNYDPDKPGSRIGVGVGFGFNYPEVRLRYPSDYQSTQIYHRGFICKSILDINLTNRWSISQQIEYNGYKLYFDALYLSLLAPDTEISQKYHWIEFPTVLKYWINLKSLRISMETGLTNQYLHSAELQIINGPVVNNKFDITKSKNRYMPSYTIGCGFYNYHGNGLIGISLRYKINLRYITSTYATSDDTSDLFYFFFYVDESHRINEASISVHYYFNH